MNVIWVGWEGCDWVVVAVVVTGAVDEGLTIDVVVFELTAVVVKVVAIGAIVDVDVPKFKLKPLVVLFVFNVEFGTWVDTGKAEAPKVVLAAKAGWEGVVLLGTPNGTAVAGFVVVVVAAALFKLKLKELFPKLVEVLGAVVVAAEKKLGAATAVVTAGLVVAGWLKLKEKPLCCVFWFNAVDVLVDPNVFVPKLNKPVFDAVVAAGAPKVVLAVFPNEIPVELNAGAEAPKAGAAAGADPKAGAAEPKAGCVWGMKETVFWVPNPVVLDAVVVVVPKENPVPKPDILKNFYW